MSHAVFKNCSTKCHGRSCAYGRVVLCRDTLYNGAYGVYGVTRPLGTVVDCQTFMTVQNLHSLCSRGIPIHAPSHSLLAVLRKASFTSHDETVQFRRRCELDSRRLSYSSTPSSQPWPSRTKCFQSFMNFGLCIISGVAR